MSDRAAGTDLAGSRDFQRRALIAVSFVLAGLCVGLLILKLDRATSGTGDSSRPPRCCRVEPGRSPQFRLLVPHATVAFGEVEQGTQLVRRVPFDNVGSGPLCILNVVADCACLSVDLTGSLSVLRPRERGSLRLTLDTTGLAGLVRKKVHVFTNEPVTAHHRFTVVFRVAAGVIALPSRMVFLTVPPGTPSQSRVSLFSSRTEPAWEVVGASGDVASEERVVYSVRTEAQHTGDRWCYLVTVTHPGTMDPGSAWGHVQFRTTHQNTPTIRLAAVLTVLARIETSVDLIDFGTVPLTVQTTTKRVRIVGGDVAIGFDVLNAFFQPDDSRKTEDAGVVFVAKIGRDDVSWWVDLVLEEVGRPGRVCGDLCVVTTDELQSLLTLPVVVHVVNSGAPTEDVGDRPDAMPAR